MSAREAILSLLKERGPGKTICPSEAARRVSPDSWRDHMQAIHLATRDLCRAGKVLVTQKGERVDPATAKGPVRLGLPEE